MRPALLALAASAAIALPAAAQVNQASPGQSPARGVNPDPAVTVQLITATGQPAGTVEIRQLTHGTVFIADLRNLPPGPHGFHIHESGACDPPSFQAAGGHYNPLNTEHGFDSARGYHAGDLPNIHVTPQGTAKAEFHSTRVTLMQRMGAQPAGTAGPFTLLDDNGSALMIHAKGDDYQATTPDSTGERIACGVIRAP
ncbi:MAG TPA: superoxide dismutase family protein [Falsiroseomonas sp.]|jgi:Cu-Zn family superoxide dismutase|nr:superoxide dismutase family protein [Falsiroseomonas sp.]